MYEIALGIGNTGQRIMPNLKDMFFNLQAYISSKIRLLGVSIVIVCIVLNCITFYHLNHAIHTQCTR